MLHLANCAPVLSRPSFCVWATKVMYCLLCSTQGRLCTTFMFVTCLSGYETLALVVVMKNTEVNKSSAHTHNWLVEPKVLAIEHT